RRANCIRIDPPSAIGRQISDVESLFLETLAGIEHGLVLDARGDDMPSAVRVRAREPENRQIVGFGRPGGEHDLVRLGADQCADLGPRRLDARGRLPADRKSTRLNSSHVKISYA